jgi:membrane protease YdiL (CAAX protease family)
MPELIPEEDLERKRYNENRGGIQYILAKFNPLSLLMIFGALLAQVYIITKYPNAEFIWYSYTLIAFGLIDIIGLAILTRGDIFYSKLLFTEPGITPKAKYIFGIILPLLGILIVMMVFQTVEKLAVSDEDMYLYYGASAILEEAFFRMFIISIFSVKKSDKRYLYIGAFVSALLFSLAHIVVYGHSIFLMLTMFFYGLILAIAFIFVQDITVCMIVHLILNLIAVGNMLVQI